MREAGFSGRARLALDLAVLEFGERFETMRHATVQESYTPPKRSRSVRDVPRFDGEQLAAFLAGEWGGTDEPDDDDEIDDDALIADMLAGKIDLLTFGV